MSDPILEAVLKVMECSPHAEGTDFDRCDICVADAAAMVAAVRPLIEADVREQIAREIDEAAGKGWMAITGDYFRSISAELAIDIARGGEP